MSLIYKYIIINQRYYMVSSTLSFWCGTILHLHQQAERGFAAWAVFVGRTVVFVRGKGKGA
jgi:hypothetical protein